METLFTVLIAVQFAVIVLHDWLEIPGWTHGHQVQSVVGRAQLRLATLVNAVFPGTAVALALYYWRKPKPEAVIDYWAVYCAITALAAAIMWYLPYLFGCSQRRKQLYAKMYAGTRQILPARGDNPRPNLLHVCFHLLFAANLILIISMRFA